jgi:hypothetical protein
MPGVLERPPGEAAPARPATGPLARDGAVIVCASRADTLSPAIAVSARWKMPRVEDDTMVVTGFEAGERARIDLEALEDPGADDDENDNQQTGGEVLLRAPAVFELLLAR